MSTQISTRTVYMWACPSCRLDGSLSTDLSVTQSEAEAHDVDVHGEEIASAAAHLNRRNLRQGVTS